MRVVGVAVKPLIWVIPFILSSLVLTGCNSAKVPTTVASCANRVSVAYQNSPEPPYCTNVRTYPTGVTITGNATYEARPYGASGLGNIGSPIDIRYAEVVAYDPKGVQVQCGETDGSGAFSLNLPTSTDTYTVKVTSRADNSMVKVSVLNCPEENLPYSISGTVVPDSSKPMGTIHASADNTGALLGAAFNIYDQIVKANDFLRAQIGTCSFTGCTSVSVAPKVQAYWAKGFNPNDYANDTGGISFYIPGYHRLFILGGIGGDIFNSDTDHFDNSIIIHEYGHFLEDVFSVTNSPGGSHYGNAIIDPRLAWSEGWGNFLQAAVRDQARYRDTDGTPNASNPTSSSSYIFNIPIETSGGCIVGSLTPGCDIPEFDYEGNFREYSITRFLWDTFDSPSNADYVVEGTDNTDAKFAEIWAVLTSSSGFKNPNAAFRNLGHLNHFQSSWSGMSDWTDIKTAHKSGDWQEYARYVKKTNSCGKVFNMIPYDDPNDNGSFGTSHLVRNNDFFHYHHPGGSLNLSLKYQTVDSGMPGYLTELVPDLDLYLYNKDADIGNSASMVETADNYWDNNPNNEQTEALSVSSLPAGDYLINVKVFTGRYQLDNVTSTNNCIGTGFRRICENDGAPDYNYIPAGDEINYELIVNGENLCPDDIP